MQKMWWSMGSQRVWHNWATFTHSLIFSYYSCYVYKISIMIVPLYSLEQQILFSPPDTSTTEWCFCFGPASSLFLKLFLHSSLVPYWTPTHLGSLSSGVISFCLFSVFMEFLRQEYWRGLPFPLWLDYISWIEAYLNECVN